MNRKIPFTNKQDIARKSKGRTIILFGAGNIAEKTQRIIANKEIHSIVDNSSNLWEEVQRNVKIVSPDYLKTKEGKSCFIIITTTSFSDVSAQLEEFGFKASEDFIVSPILNDLRIIDELE